MNKIHAAILFLALLLVLVPTVAFATGQKTGAPLVNATQQSASGAQLGMG